MVDDMSDMMEFSLRYLISALPVLVVYVGGIILTILLWQRQPRASLLLALGLAIMLVEHVLGACVFSWLGDKGGGPWDPLFLIVNFFRTLVYAGALCLVITAVFVGRGQPHRPDGTRYEPREPPSPAPEVLPPQETSAPSAHVTPERPRDPSSPRGEGSQSAPRPN